MCARESAPEGFGRQGGVAAVSLPGVAESGEKDGECQKRGGSE